MTNIHHSEFPDMQLAVSELYYLSPRSMSTIVRNSQDLTLRLTNAEGATILLDLDKLAMALPLHLLASAAVDDTATHLLYISKGIRLLHTLCELASRVPRLERILLINSAVREQILDLIFFLLIRLGMPTHVRSNAIMEPDGSCLVRPTLIASSLHLLPAVVTKEWSDIAVVLLGHSKVYLFMDTAIDCIRKSFEMLQGQLEAAGGYACVTTGEVAAEAYMEEREVEAISMQCEASLQALRMLISSRPFRDCLLRHEEVCQGGGLLRLLLAILKLRLPWPWRLSPYLRATISVSISRMKSRALAIMVLVCETESDSFLDIVARSHRSARLATQVILEVCHLVAMTLKRPVDDDFIDLSLQDIEKVKRIPHGLLQVNTLRMADVLSDDSNFRTSLMDYSTPCLAEMLAAPPAEFVSHWLGGEVARGRARKEADAFVVYRPFHALGAVFQLKEKWEEFHDEVKKAGDDQEVKISVLDLINKVPGADDAEAPVHLKPEKMAEEAHVHEMASLLVHLFGNLLCYNPYVTSETRDQFLKNFIDCLKVGPLLPDHQCFIQSRARTAVRICENLYLLVEFVMSLPEDKVANDDIYLVSRFSEALHGAICSHSGLKDSCSSTTDHSQEASILDAHEQNLHQWQSRREQQPRWQRLMATFAEGEFKQEGGPGASRRMNGKEANEVGGSPARGFGRRQPQDEGLHSRKAGFMGMGKSRDENGVEGGKGSSWERVRGGSWPRRSRKGASQEHMKSTSLKQTGNKKLKGEDYRSGKATRNQGGKSIKLGKPVSEARKKSVEQKILGKEMTGGTLIERQSKDDLQSVEQSGEQQGASDVEGEGNIRSRQKTRMKKLPKEQTLQLYERDDGKGSESESEGKQGEDDGESGGSQKRGMTDEEDETMERKLKKVKREVPSGGTHGWGNRPRKKVRRKWTSGKRAQKRVVDRVRSRGKVKALDSISGKGVEDDIGDGVEVSDAEEGEARLKSVGRRKRGEGDDEVARDDAQEVPSKMSKQGPLPGIDDKVRVARRRIMTEDQADAMEEALREEPDMHRFPELLQQWVNVLNDMVQGSRISITQLKNWINNHKHRGRRPVASRAVRRETVLAPPVLPAKRRRPRTTPEKGEETAGADASLRKKKRKVPPGERVRAGIVQSGPEGQLDAAGNESGRDEDSVLKHLDQRQFDGDGAEEGDSEESEEEVEGEDEVDGGGREEDGDLEEEEGEGELDGIEGKGFVKKAGEIRKEQQVGDEKDKDENGNHDSGEEDSLEGEGGGEEQSGGEGQEDESEDKEDESEEEDDDDLEGKAEEGTGKVKAGMECEDVEHEEGSNGEGKGRSRFRESATSAKGSSKSEHADRGNRLRREDEVEVLDADGELVGQGLVIATRGKWKKMQLGNGLCLVYIGSLEAPPDAKVPFPTKKGGQTFYEAIDKKGRLILAWRSELLKLRIGGPSIIRIGKQNQEDMDSQVTGANEKVPSEQASEPSEELADGKEEVSADPQQKESVLMDYASARLEKKEESVAKSDDNEIAGQ